MVKRLPTMQEIRVQSLGREDVLEKEMATHSSILAWKTPWMEEPGRLQSMGSQRVGYDWATSLSHIYLGFPGGSDSKESAWNAGDLGLIPGLGWSPGEGSSYPFQYSGLENSMDCIAHGTAESNMTERLSLFTMNLKILILVLAFSLFGKCIIPRDLF